MATKCGYLASDRQEIKNETRWRERSSMKGGTTQNRECGPSWKASATPGCGAVSVYSGGHFIGWWVVGVCQRFSGKSRDFQELGQHPCFDHLTSRGTVMAPLHVSPTCRVSKGFKTIYLFQVLVVVCNIFISAHWLWCPMARQVKEMATHSSILAWKIQWMEEPGGPMSMGRKHSDTTEQPHFLSFRWNPSSQVRD